MSQKNRPLNWLCVAAFAAAFWITLRVVAAAPPPPANSSFEPAGMGELLAPDEIRDPALERMVARFAATANVPRN